MGFVEVDIHAQQPPDLFHQWSVNIQYIEFFRSITKKIKSCFHL